jgi:hypothetical protein
MTDKDSRKIETILKGNLVSDETVVDTAKDDAVYNKIFIILWKEFSKNKYAAEILKHFVEVKKLLERRDSNETKEKKI